MEWQGRRQTKNVMPPAINLPTNPAPQGLGLFLFTFVNIPQHVNGAKRKGIRKISSLNFVPLMSDLLGRSSKNEA
jgi:hypothetical protein